MLSHHSGNRGHHWSGLPTIHGGQHESRVVIFACCYCVSWEPLVSYLPTYPSALLWKRQPCSSHSDDHRRGGNPYKGCSKF